MKIEWLGHSCFRISHKGYVVVLDPYKANLVLRLKKMHTSANLVLCSHEHGDHNYREAVELIKTDVENPFTIETMDTFHDSAQGHKRGNNKITIMKTEKCKLAHLGDLGCKLKEDQIEQLRGLDVLMIPVGGLFTINPEEAKEICEILNPKIIIPMHYKGKKSGPIMLASIDKFLDLFDKNLVKEYETNSIEIDDKLTHQVAVLEYIG